MRSHYIKRQVIIRRTVKFNSNSQLLEYLLKFWNDRHPIRNEIIIVVNNLGKHHQTIVLALSLMSYKPNCSLFPTEENIKQFALGTSETFPSRAFSLLYNSQWCLLKCPVHNSLNQLFSVVNLRLCQVNFPLRPPDLLAFFFFFLKTDTKMTDYSQLQGPFSNA